MPHEVVKLECMIQLRFAIQLWYIYPSSLCVQCVGRIVGEVDMARTGHTPPLPGTHSPPLPGIGHTPPPLLIAPWPRTIRDVQLCTQTAAVETMVSMVQRQGWVYTGDQEVLSKSFVVCCCWFTTYFSLHSNISEKLQGRPTNQRAEVVVRIE